MCEPVLVTKDLTKIYDKVTVLNNINIEIDKGKIYGFIGQNGAGKTTFIRLIAGLSFSTSGEIILFGHRDKNALQVQRKRIGFLVERPALYPDMTAVQNIKIQQIEKGIKNNNEILEILNLVGLSNTGKKKVRNFSLGMRQRLGIGISLINNPELLILDEPINGLDPKGIVEIRDLLLRLNRERGTTIIISSHILEELYNTVSEFILIDRGNIIEQITKIQLDERCRKYILLRTTDNKKILERIKIEFKTEDYEILTDGAIKIYNHLQDIEQLSSICAEEKILITEIKVIGDSIEEYFLSKIGGK